ncbi:unnamed protein product [Brassicogethes aeneus]|uniref:Uncharacterized protein n=1 Tax=Brassicogethes aeneus TaxID=1431903 RepID=A0A9P0BI06_BRAAE|nr:unnamed protein product [Brassicogethes aeneus]
MEREKPLLPTKSVQAATDHAAVHKSRASGLQPFAIFLSPEEELCSPTVGRWGCEWPRPKKGPRKRGGPAENYGDVGELIERTQRQGPWPLDHPLPLPRWSDEKTKYYKLGSVSEFQEMATKIELQLQRVLEEQNYNTVGNFLTFYEAYKENPIKNVMDFYQCYSPKITPQNYSCVGLAFELWFRLQKLENLYPELAKFLCVVSCEENIESIYEYSSRLDTASSSIEKEHVLVCLKFDINGRKGVLLCDPGYHVARVVTVMYDKAFPNTGWFIQSEENNIRKEYNYQISPYSDRFVEWNERTTKGSQIDIFTGLIYVERPYITAVDVTDRRNIVYNFKSLLSRDQKGHLIAGLYFKVKEGSDEFTIFYQDMGKQRVKMNFSSFLTPEVRKLKSNLQKKSLKLLYK